nr:helix-turn-helix transcriptional regulator [Pseudonocardia sp. HH130630-07]
MSKYHFLRCFTAVYGRTPAATLTRRRIERAQDLLRATDLTVTEVCTLVGYSSPGSFGSRFRLLVGTGPATYRARWTARGAPGSPGAGCSCGACRTPQSRRGPPDRGVARFGACSPTSRWSRCTSPTRTPRKASTATSSGSSRAPTSRWRTATAG